MDHILGTEEQCANYIICNSKCPPWLLHYNSGLCPPCNIKYHNRLQFIDQDTCPICLGTSPCVNQNFCDHHICTDCFEYLYNTCNEPRFPYYKLSDIYQKDPYNERGLYYDLIEEFNNKWKIWDEIQSQRMQDPFYKKCPLCNFKAIN